VLKLQCLTSVLKQNHFMFRLDDSMAGVFVYGVAMAADVFANCQTCSLNIIFQS